MSDWFVVLSCGLVAGAAGFWLTRRRNEGSTEPAGERTRHPYRCVAIRGGGNSCAAANDLDGRRFLPAEAPLLPLHTCNASPCQCTYVRFEDRRDEERRRPHAMGRGFVDATGGMERRGANDRRNTAKYAAV